MNTDILRELPAREGHFRLESGYHTDLWLTLDALLVSPREAAPLVAALAERLKPHGVDAVCGPLVGGAFLAQAIAYVLDVDFSFTQPSTPGAALARRSSRRRPLRAKAADRLFTAEYALPAGLRQRVRGQRVAVVDDAISAGSSVRATAAALGAAGATTAVVGTLLLLGTRAREHFAAQAIPVESLASRELTLWEPSACPLCADGVPLATP